MSAIQQAVEAYNLALAEIDKKIWTARDGSEHKVADMDDGYISNVLNWLKKNPGVPYNKIWIDVFEEELATRRRWYNPRWAREFLTTPIEMPQEDVAYYVYDYDLKSGAHTYPEVSALADAGERKAEARGSAYVHKPESELSPLATYVTATPSTTPLWVHTEISTTGEAHMTVSEVPPEGGKTSG